jgi:hypothetical protein
MSNETEKIYTAVYRFIEYLSSLDGDERERGLLAAQNFQRTLSLLQSDLSNGLGQLRYDIGGKGVLDWVWSNEHLSQIEGFSNEIFELIDTI